MTSLPVLDELDLVGRVVLVRSDLNVPLIDGRVADDFRIRASVPTIEALLERDARVVVCSHLGRPDGFDPSLALDPVAARLAELADIDVHKVDAVVGPLVEDAIASSGERIFMLENTRFEPGEVANDPEFARSLAGLADVFVLDAFGSAHRAHASTVGVAEILPSAAGRLMAAEVDALTRLRDEPPHPYVVVMGGAKVSDKLGVIRRMVETVDLMLVGGGMCFTLLAAGGYDIGESLVEKGMLDEVRGILRSDHGGKIVLPEDVVVGDRFSADASRTVVKTASIPDGSIGLDIGPDSAAHFGSVLSEAAGVFWNGPMGVFEWEAFSSGTAAVAEAISRSDGFTVIGGGDTVAAAREFNIVGDVSHLSTGGGAGLELLEGRELPGVVALRRWANA